MHIEIDIFRAGVKQGSGPIHEVTSLSFGDRLNESNTWSFSARLGHDSPTLHLIEDNECFGYAVSAAGRVALFAGRMLEVKPIFSNGKKMIAVSGAGLVSDLAFDHVPRLEIFENYERAPKDARTITSDGEVSIAAWIDGSALTNHAIDFGKFDWIYIYDTSKFSAVHIDVLVNNTNSGGIQCQTFTNALPSGKKGWSDVNVSVDGWGTDFASVPFGTVGTKIIEFDPVDSWDEVLLDGLQGYYFRFRATDARLQMTISGIRAVIRGPNKTNDVEVVVDASTDFAMMPGSLLNSKNGYYGIMDDISILSALRRVAGSSLDIIRLGAINRREIEVLRADNLPQSTIRAVSGSMPGFLDRPEETGLIPFQDFSSGLDDLVVMDAQPKQDFRSKVNKLFAYGNGSGSGSHYTISDHNLVEGVDYPAGYVINRDESSVTWAAGFAVSPLSSSVRYRDVQTIDGNMQGAEVSNQILLNAIAELEQRKTGVKHYGLKIAGFRGSIVRSGDLLNVEFTEFEEGVNLFSITGDWMVTATRYTLKSGILVCDATVSNITRPPMDETGFTLAEMENRRRAETTEQRLRGFALWGPRVPTEGDEGGEIISEDPPLRQVVDLKICVDQDAFVDEFDPTHGEFLNWLLTNEYPGGAEFVYYVAGTGSADDPDVTWQSDGLGNAVETFRREI